MLAGSSEAASDRIWGGIGLVFLARGAAFVGHWVGLERWVAASPLLVCALVVYLSGCVAWARGKGYPGYVGAVGVLWLIGLLVLFLLPDRHPDAGPQQRA